MNLFFAFRALGADVACLGALGISAAALESTLLPKAFIDGPGPVWVEFKELRIRELP